MKDLQIVELASVLAGPSVGMFFAELGATVIKIENKKTGGDVTRTWRLPSESEEGVSAYFSSVNWGKQHLFLDLNDPQDRAIAIAQIAKADIVISNYKEGDDIKLGMDYASLEKLNNKLIYGRISGFGPGDERPAFDVVLQAESGFMAMNGTPDSGPLKMPVALIDVLAAHQLKEALLLALIKRDKKGEGSYVNVSLYDSAVCSLMNQATNYLMAHHIPGRQGSLHPNIAPYGETFITNDKRFVVLAVGNDAQFKLLCNTLGDPMMPTLERYKTNPERVKNRKMLYDELAPLFYQYDRDSLMDLLIKNGIPAGAVRSMDEVFSDHRSQSLLLGEEVDGQMTIRVRSTAFDPNTVL